MKWIPKWSTNQLFYFNSAVSCLLLKNSRRTNKLFYSAAPLIFFFLYRPTTEYIYFIWYYLYSYTMKFNVMWTNANNSQFVMTEIIIIKTCWPINTRVWAKQAVPNAHTYHLFFLFVLCCKISETICGTSAQYYRNGICYIRFIVIM